MGVGPDYRTVKRSQDVGVERIIPGRELISRDSSSALPYFHGRVLSNMCS